MSKLLIEKGFVDLLNIYYCKCKGIGSYLDIDILKFFSRMWLMLRMFEFDYNSLKRSDNVFVFIKVCNRRKGFIGVFEFFLVVI